MTSGQLATNGWVIGVGVDAAGTAQVVYGDSDRGALLSVRRPRDGTWTAPQPFSLPSGVFELRQNPAGDLAAYGQDSGVLKVAVRREGVWSSTKTLAVRVKSSSVHFNDAGQVLAVWSGPNGVQACIRTASGSWGPRVRLAGPATRGAPLFPVAAFNARGAAVVAWLRNVRPAVVLQVAERRPGGVWSRPRNISGRPVSIDGSPVLALNARGDALVGWAVRRPVTSPGQVLRVVAHRIGTRRWSAPGVLPGFRGLGHVDIELDERGRGIAVWGHSVQYPLYSAVRATNGRWTSTGTLPGSECCTWTPIVVTPDGTTVVGGPARSPSSDAMRVWRRRPGGRWTVSPPAVGRGGNAIQLEANSSGDVVAAWTGHEGHTYNPVFAAAYQDPR